MTELDHVQADVLKDLGKMVIAGAGIMALLALLLWGLMTSAEAVGSLNGRQVARICSCTTSHGFCREQLPQSVIYASGRALISDTPGAAQRRQLAFLAVCSC